MKKFTLVVAYLACGFYAYGTFTAQMHHDCTHEFASQHLTARDNVGLCAGEALAGPAGAVAAALITNFNQYGFELWWVPQPQDRP